MWQLFKETFDLILDFPNVLKLYKLEFVEKVEISPDVWTFSFNKPNSWSAKAGQHLLLHVPHKHGDIRGSRRLFSISSAPHEQYIMITTRFFGDKSSTFKQALMALTPGSIVMCRGPIDKYYVTDTDAHMVFIAGGIGITPIRSILADLDHRQVDINATLFYANRDDNYIFKSELEALSKQHQNFHIKYFRGPQHIEIEDISKAGNKESIYFISGTIEFVTAYANMLSGMAVPHSQIKFDKFRPLIGSGYQSELAVNNS